MFTLIVGAGAVILSAGSLLASLYIVALALLGLIWRRRSNPPKVPGLADTQFLLLIPAHNEESGIRATIESVLNLQFSAGKLNVVVVADNCDDHTAAVAESCGVQVWVRTDVLHPGKGQALAWALEHAAKLQFELLVVIDADTQVDSQFLVAMDRAYRNAQHLSDALIFQGRYEFAASDEKAGWFEAFTLASKDAENTFVYLPRSHMGLMNLLQGNGFCVSRQALRDVPFAASSVVEDAEYAVSLALKGLRVRYVDDARVISRTTRSIHDAAPQRLRWATGVFQLIARSVPKLLLQAIVRADWKLAEGAIMMLLTSRLVLIYLSVTALACVVLSIHGPQARLAAILLLMTVILQSVYLVLTFRSAGKRPYAMSSLFFMPFYVTLICIAQVCALLGFKRRQWSRTVR